MPLDVPGVLELASSSGPRIRIHAKDIVEVIKAAKVKVDAFVDADEDEVEASPAHNLNLLDTEELEANFDAYLSEFQKAKTRQSQSFTRNVTDLQQDKSRFLGKTVKNTGVLFIERVEHIGGISLLEDESMLAEFLGVTAESAAMTKAPAPVAVAAQPAPRMTRTLCIWVNQALLISLLILLTRKKKMTKKMRMSPTTRLPVALRLPPSLPSLVITKRLKAKMSASTRRRAK